MENTVLAKALYDNTAECSDELAFRKGDILTVMEQNVPGSVGWWNCSLHGRQGLAPANRLLLLTPSQVEALYPDKPCAGSASGSSPGRSMAVTQNIYQIPTVPRQQCSPSPAYECMERIYEVPSSASSSSSCIPSATLPARWSPVPGTPSKDRSAAPSPTADVYDVPSLVRKASLCTMQAPRPLIRKSSLASMSELEKRYEVMGCKLAKSSCPNNVYAVPPSVSPEPSYDIPVPSTADPQHRLACGYSTLPSPRKSDWIYDVPMPSEKPGIEKPGYSYGTMPAKGLSAASAGKPFYDTLPAHVWSPRTSLGADMSNYDIPKPSPNAQQRLAGSSGTTGIYDIPPGQKQPEVPDSTSTAPQDALVSRSTAASQKSASDVSTSTRGHVPLECRASCGPTYDHPRGRQPRGRLGLMSLLEEDGCGEQQRPCGGRSPRSSVTGGSQRISTASTSSTVSSSSTSSCDSLVLLSSSSPELLREVTLPQEEACRRLVELQGEVCQAVPRLMVFVSSRWRCRAHLEEHLAAIRAAAEDIGASTTRFLNFALDVRGNARRLTDSNLQARLLKQLSIVEDSGLILQQTVDSLERTGWSLDALAQDPGQTHTPDQLERFVMVARTVPEDIKRLVSILNANGKLLFRLAAQQKEPEPESPKQSTPPPPPPPDLKKRDGAKREQVAEPEEDDNDYVQLHTKEEIEEQQRSIQDNRRSKESPSTPKTQGSPPSLNSPKVSEKEPPSPPKGPKPTLKQPQQKSALSEHCRLYFGALQRAINEFVSSILDGQPPETFISHSKLVIMVGQRLVNALCNEANQGTNAASTPGTTTTTTTSTTTTTNTASSGNSSSGSGGGGGSSSRSDLLHRSNHLCALLKQLAVATKKAALHFPDQLALQEAQKFAKELAQRAQHFRHSLEV
ncbi:cas scaffolding protein family member 4 [Engraulis encrasicolus]|uniref:cas scaffolding protein family member 4 n=1 Tax=Engraulis encrasicolus TaxID=184585 RepID=UPI002FD69EB1